VEVLAGRSWFYADAQGIIYDSYPVLEFTLVLRTQIWSLESRAFLVSLYACALNKQLGRICREVGAGACDFLARISGLLAKDSSLFLVEAL
jgi:hypothetical protein